MIPVLSAARSARGTVVRDSNPRGFWDVCLSRWMRQHPAFARAANRCLRKNTRRTDARFDARVRRAYRQIDKLAAGAHDRLSWEFRRAWWKAVVR